MANTIDKQHIKDIQFMKIAKTVAQFSKCSSRQIGTVLVKDGCVISTGYNGTPRGISECQDTSKPCKRREMGFASGKGLEYCGAVHAEVNAIIQAARSGVSTCGATLYCYCGQVCRNCAGSIINAGITRLVYLGCGVPYDELSGEYLKESGIEVCTIKPSDVEQTEL